MPNKHIPNCNMGGEAFASTSMKSSGQNDIDNNEKKHLQDEISLPRDGDSPKTQQSGQTIHMDAETPSRTKANPSTTRGTMYLILTNISKRTNVRSLLMTAAAFGCRAVFVAGQRKFDFDPDGPDVPNVLRNHIKNGHMKIERFEKLNEVVSHIRSLPSSISIEEGKDEDVKTGQLKQDRETIQQESSGVRIVGVEIDEKSIHVECAPFVGDTALMMGNEGQGLSEKQKSLCDGFVKISQYGNGTASLNVNVAASIVMHRFQLWSMGVDVGDTI